ncbi:MAG: MFS transporter [Lentisphaerae bacterium]|nr:MFS transporter [Lentisphaerota bacterium]MCP4100581.1 MFS transporter [Lentisphaerota bacterium]
MLNLLRQKPMRLAVAWFVNSLGFSIIYPFLPLYLHNNRGFDMSTVGLIFPAMGVGVVLGPPISGWLVDHIGRRLILVGGPILQD